MKTGFRGTFVISWSQTELDGLWSAPLDTLRVGASWSWTGDAVRVDGPTEILALGEAEGMANLRKRAAHSVRRLLVAADVGVDALTKAEVSAPMSEKSFCVTDGRETWTITLIETGKGRPPLLMFVSDVPPRHSDLWIVSHNIEIEARNQTSDVPGGVICFTPGTTIMTEHGPRLVESLREGDRVQTKDNGCQEILWIGQRRVSGARLYAMPHLKPIRLRAGALDKGVPDEGLLVSPDHRMILRGARAQALFNCDEVLVTARDLINDSSVLVDHSTRQVTYIHMLLPSHQVVFANNVETESFHPAAASLSHLGDEDVSRLLSRVPEVGDDPHAYGAFARRVLSASEVAILRHDGGWGQAH